LGAHVGIGETVTWNRSDPLERSTAEDGKRESKRANQAVRDYLLMGPARSLRKLLASYQGDENAPTHSWAQLSFLSVKFDWVARSEQFDKLQQDKARAAYEARRAEIMEKGFALAHERVAVLSDMAKKLLTEFDEEDRLWLPDVKGIGSNENFQAIDIVRFNAGLVSEIRGILDDLAAETGGRVKETKNSGSIQLVQITSDDLANARKSATDYERELLDDGAE
jgi:hypothetical protein